MTPQPYMRVVSHLTAIFFLGRQTLAAATVRHGIILIYLMGYCMMTPRLLHALHLDRRKRNHTFHLREALQKAEVSLALQCE
jgi:hypothetical protein